jgi:hypothetical protein
MSYPAFYCTRTLLGGTPDINRRAIYAEDTELRVMVFNEDLKPWTPEMQAAVDRELKALNDLAGLPRKRLPNGMVVTYGGKR